MRMLECAEQNGNALYRDAGEKQLCRKRVAESVSMAAVNFGRLKEALQLRLPISGCRLFFAGPRPEVKTLTRLERRFKCSDDKRRQWTAHRCSCFRGVK